MSKQFKASDIDDKFDKGEDVSEYFDFEHAKVLENGNEVKRVNVDFPIWMIHALDEEADRLAISRQAVIKTWIAEKLDARKPA